MRDASVNAMKSHSNELDSIRFRFDPVSIRFDFDVQCEQTICQYSIRYGQGVTFVGHNCAWYYIWTRGHLCRS